MTPFARRRQQIMATLRSTKNDVRADDGYALMQMQLHQDMERLHGILSNEQKAAVKRQILPHYDEWVNGVLEGDSGLQDDVLMRVMIWRIDAGLYDEALDIAAYALRHNLNTPDGFGRSTAALVADEISQQALIRLKNGEDVPAALLSRVREMTDGADLFDAVRARLYKALGYALRNEGQLQEARDVLNRALELHDGVGVKADLKALDKQLAAD
ncbi:hypothetical protein AXA88_26670 [Salmonella enterica]|nr:hypothetical protein [Salmonella enterica]HEC8455390.1 hypothetical protein [Salmonella enterica subsp. enterica serovar Poona]EAX3609402.1 hypothetical protein [Salmonella enterica]EGW6282938.1 hypothetical protein [Salmonella enterica]EGX3935357.1 hypothetical protein [Salmonella enterica]